jgi:predicted dienelactone hydrolase
MAKRTLLFGVLLFTVFAAAAEKIDDKSGMFVDTARDRKIPYKIDYPKPLEGQHAVIILSHPLGGSRDSNEALARHLAGHGFIVVRIQHQGSDDGLLQGIRDRRMAPFRLAQSLRDPRNAQNRFLDTLFVVSELPNLNSADKQLKGHLNLQALGMAGHSYGATSTMVAAGERVGAISASFKVPMLKAGLLMSPSPSETSNVERAYGDISIPLFHMTGTLDESLVEGRNVHASDRTKPYRLLSISNQYLLVLNGADHIAFSNESHDKRYMVAVLNGALAFFQAYLNDDRNAENWLRNEYKKTLAEGDEFEYK